MLSKRWLAYVVLCVFLVPACASDGGGGDDPGQAEDRLQPVTIAFFQIVKFAFLPTLLAEELGYYQEFGVDVNIRGFATGIESFEAMVAGEADLATPGTVGVVLARGAGSDVKVIFAPASRLSPVIVATTEIHSCEDLKGRTVATDGPGGLAHGVMEAFLATCGLDINSDVEVFIGSPADYGPLLAQEAIQAAGQEIDDKAVIEEEFGIQLNILANTWEVVDFHYQSLATTADTLEEKRDAIVRTVAAIMKANRWLNDPSNRDQVLDIAVELSERTAAPRSREAFALAYDAYVPAGIFPTDCDAALSPQPIETLVDLQLELGNLDESVSYEELVALDICQEAQKLVEEDAA